MAKTTKVSNYNEFAPRAGPWLTAVTTTTVLHALQAGEGDQALTRQLILLINQFSYQAPRINQPYTVEHITRCFGSLFATIDIIYCLRLF